MAYPSIKLLIVFLSKIVLLSYAFKSDGILLPSSPSRIKVLFMKHFQDVKSEITKKIIEIIKCNGCLLISFDESTSTRNRRFIKLNLRFSTDFQSLGLIRVVGSMKD